MLLAYVLSLHVCTCMMECQLWCAESCTLYVQVIDLLRVYVSLALRIMCIVYADETSLICTMLHVLYMVQ